MMKEEFCLYRERDLRIIGTDETCNFFVIEAMRKGIKLGHVFPAIELVDMGDFFGIKNGHHRKLVHDAEGVRSNYVFSKRDLGTDIYVPLEEIIVEKDLDWFAKDKLRDSLGYLPRPLAKQFCLDNGLNPNHYLSQ